MTPEERSAYQKRIHPNQSATASRVMRARWAKCVGEDRAKRCAHITSPEAQAKSHAAQRTPEVIARKSASAKAAWERLTPREKARRMARLHKASRMKGFERRAARAAAKQKEKRQERPRFAPPLRGRPVVGIPVSTRRFRWNVANRKAVRFPSSTDAAKWLVKAGIAKSFAAARCLISYAVTGRRPNAYGFVWRRVNGMLTNPI